MYFDDHKGTHLCSTFVTISLDSYSAVLYIVIVFIIKMSLAYLSDTIVFRLLMFQESLGITACNSLVF